MIARLAPALLTLAVAAASATAQWTLVWSDEFEGATLDTVNNWEVMIGTGTAYGLPAGWGNNELQYYTANPANLSVSDGKLHIVALYQSIGGRQYSSARIRSKGKQDFLYGRIEASIKLPSGQGIWPAFWMLPTDSPYGGWASSGEIDIVESTNAADLAYGTIHFGDGWPNNVSSGGSYSPVPDLSTGFHTYAIEWEPDQIRWYLDGVNFVTRSSSQWWSAAAPSNPRAPFDSPFHILLNVAVGGDWPGPPNGSVGFPMEMTVEYVRVYQSAPPEQDPFLGTPHPIPGQIEAEDFDTGGEGVAYHDVDGANNGGAYRPSDAVDLEAAAEGGYNIGWVREGEWAEYTVDVLIPGQYTVEARVASDTTGGTFHLEFTGDAGSQSSGTFIAPVTGGWQSWTTVSTTVTLDAGPHVMRFVNDGSSSSEYNLSWFNFIPPPSGCVGDLNNSGSTDVFDFSIFASNFGQTVTPGTGGDLDSSGTVDVFDFATFAGDFGCAE